MAEIFTTSVTIDAPPSRVWVALTNAEQMAKWMGEPEMNLEIHTDWKINSPVIIRFFHHIQSENKGLVLEYVKEKRLSYTLLSSTSRLADVADHYSVLVFTLTPVDAHTLLTLHISNFPTETIRKHLEFYWRTTILKIEKFIKEQPF